MTGKTIKTDIYSGPNRRKGPDPEEHKTLRFHLAGDANAKVTVAFFRYGVYALIAYLTTNTINHVAEQWAGKTTVAKVDVNVSGSVEAKGEGRSEKDGKTEVPLNLDPWVAAGALVLVIMSVNYGKRQEKLRKDVVERMHKYQQKYEETLHPKRSSSKLTKRGETRPGDE